MCLSRIKVLSLPSPFQIKSENSEHIPLFSIPLGLHNFGLSASDGAKRTNLGKAKQAKARPDQTKGPFNLVSEMALHSSTLLQYALYGPDFLIRLFYTCGSNFMLQGRTRGRGRGQRQPRILPYTPNLLTSSALVSHFSAHIFLPSIGRQVRVATEV